MSSSTRSNNDAVASWTVNVEPAPLEDSLILSMPL
jgi:hypothetical protein